MLNETIQAGHKFCEKIGGHFVHPYDDMDIMVGQASIGIEIFAQLNKKNLVPDAIVVGVGGGGCAGGIAIAMKMMLPNVKIFCVESENADKLNLSFKLNRHFHFKQVDNFAEGTAMNGVGEIN